MKICVLNGSPKGDYSISFQTVLYLEKKYPACQFSVLHVGQRIKAYEKDMSEALKVINDAEMLLFCYPVYTFIAPYQLHRFIELLKESGTDLSGKFAAQISTSKHFFDVTAHNYIRENCLDLGLKYIGGLSADMDDLLLEKGRKDAVAFWDYVLFCTGHDLFDSPDTGEKTIIPVYRPALPESPKSDAFDTVILTNCEPDDASLTAMMTDFKRYIRTRLV